MTVSYPEGMYRIFLDGVEMEEGDWTDKKDGEEIQKLPWWWWFLMLVLLCQTWVKFYVTLTVLRKH